MAVGGWPGRDHEPRHRRDRLRAADLGGAGRRPGARDPLSLESHHLLDRRRRRTGRGSGPRGCGHDADGQDARTRRPGSRESRPDRGRRPGGMHRRPNAAGGCKAAAGSWPWRCCRRGIPGAAAGQSPDETAAGPLGLGRAATAAEIAALDIDVRPDGAGLPLGGGTVADGARVWGRACRACHGPEGEGGIAAPVVGRDPAARPPHRRQLLALRHDPLRLHLPCHARQRAGEPDPRRGVRARRLDPREERHHRRRGGDERRHPAQRGHAPRAPASFRTTAWRATRSAEQAGAGGEASRRTWTGECAARLFAAGSRALGRDAESPVRCVLADSGETPAPVAKRRGRARPARVRCVVTGGRAVGAPNGSRAAGAPDDGRAAGVPHGSRAAGAPNGSRAAGAPHGSRTAGVPNGSRTASAPGRPRTTGARPPPSARRARTSSGCRRPTCLSTRCSRWPR